MCMGTVYMRKNKNDANNIISAVRRKKNVLF